MTQSTVITANCLSVKASNSATLSGCVCTYVRMHNQISSKLNITELTVFGGGLSNGGTSGPREERGRVRG